MDRRNASLFRLLGSRELRPGANTHLDHKLASSLVGGFIYRAEIRGSYSCVNAIQLDRQGRFLFAGGDDRRVLMYDLSDDPTSLRHTKSFTGHASNIFAIQVSDDASTIFSCGNDGLIITNDIERGLGDVTVAHQDGCLSISLEPEGGSRTLLSAGHDGTVRLWDVRTQTTAVAEMDFPHEMNSVSFSPTVPHIFVASGNRSDVALFDTRMCFTESVTRRERALVRFNLKLTVPVQNRFARSMDVTNVVFDTSGRHVIATVSKWLPTVFETSGPLPVLVLDHRPRPEEPQSAPRYRNSVTVKTCRTATFGGKDLFLSGSDDFSGFVWQLPSSYNQFASSPDTERLTEVGFAHDGGVHFPPVLRRADHVLLGARSITNSAMFHPTLPWVFTAGVEKVVRLHSAIPLDDKPADQEPPKRDSLMADPDSRRRVLRDIILSEGMVEDEETELGEDERTLGFFDMLNHREERDTGQAVGYLHEGLLLAPGQVPDSDSDGDESDSTSESNEIDEWLTEAADGADFDGEATGEDSSGNDEDDMDGLEANEPSRVEDMEAETSEARGIKRRRDSSDEH